MSRAESTTPFTTATAQKPKIVRLLAYEGYFDPKTFEAFEHMTGFAVAYDTYSLALEIPEKWKDGPYDVVVMPGATLARRIAAGALAKLDRRKLENAHGVQPAIDAKLAVYDATLAYSVPFGWAPYGLIYDREKVPARLGGAPSSWATLLDPRNARRLTDCGVATPNARDAVFVAAWRLMGVDPAHARPLDIKHAAAVLAWSKPAWRGFAVADPIGAMARGAFCLTVGTPGEAAAANARATAIGGQGRFEFVEPREGGGVEIETMATPRESTNPDIAYKLIDFLLTPDVAAQNARVAGLYSPIAAPDADLIKRLWPLGAFDDYYAQALETEWTHLRTSK